jgi:hypothetical protein
MPLLNPPDALPEAMRFILRVLLANDGPLPEQEVRRLVVPTGLNRRNVGLDDDAQEAGGPAKIFKASLDALRGLQLVTQEFAGERKVTVEPWVCDRFEDWPGLTAEEFSDFLANEIIFFPPRTGVNGVLKGGHDLSDAVSFVMRVSDPLNGFATFDGATGRKFQAVQFGELGEDLEGWVVRNGERYQSLRRWLTYIGVARIFKDGMVIEPSRRIEKHVVSIAKEQILIADFLDRLGEVLPFTDRGTEGMMMRDRMKTKFDGDAVSPGLAVGLEVLAAQGKVRLVNLDDVPSFAFPSASGSRARYSHIAAVDGR